MLAFLDHNMTRRLDAKRKEYLDRGIRVTQYLPFVYAADFLPLLGNTTLLDQVTIDMENDFLLCMQTFAAFSTGGVAQTAPNVLVKLTADVAARQLMSGQVHLINVFGTGERPYLYYEPLELPAKSSMSVEADSETATDLNLRLSFIGVKVFTERAERAPLRRARTSSMVNRYAMARG